MAGVLTTAVWPAGVAVFAGVTEGTLTPRAAGEVLEVGVLGTADFVTGVLDVLGVAVLRVGVFEETAFETEVFETGVLTAGEATCLTFKVDSSSSFRFVPRLGCLATGGVSKMEEFAESERTYKFI